VTNLDNVMPTVRSRALGEELRTVLRADGMSGHQVARRLGLYPSLLSLAINGKRRYSDVEIESILVACHVPLAERTRIRQLNQDVARRDWLQPHGPDMHDWSRTLAHHERDATRIVDVQTTLIPRLLQTDDYAHALWSHNGDISAKTRGTLVHALRDRQAIFTKERPPRTVFLVNEVALRSSIGGAVVMSDQLQHLLLTTALSHVDIRIIPSAAGVHARHSDAFTLLESDAHTPVVHIEGQGFELFLEREQQIDDHQRLISSLSDHALSHDDSITLISAIDSELHADNDTPRNPR
jgi:transcriptional regulator with XRE-family HTH domain